MNDIVTLHHNEPMTTSLAIADGVEMEHASILKLIRNHVEDLAEFGGVGFEIQPFDTNGGKQWRDVYFLNEQQSTLLITFMRNSPVVIAFKKALVRAFFAMRDRIQHRQPANPPFLTSNLSHGADLAVAADRTFRSFLRSARSAGLPLAAALRTANRQTLERTGTDMLAELDIVPEALAAAPGSPSPVADRSGVAEFAAAWLAGDLPIPACFCHSTALYDAYLHWGRTWLGALALQTMFQPQLRRAFPECFCGVRMVVDAQGEVINVRAVVPPGALDDVEPGSVSRERFRQMESFNAALREWKES